MLGLCGFKTEIQMNRLKELENPGVCQLRVRLKLGPKGRHLSPSSPSSASPRKEVVPSSRWPTLSTSAPPAERKEDMSSQRP